MGVELTEFLSKNNKMFTRAFRQTTRYATAFNSVQHRQMNQVIIPKFTHYTPISAVKLDLSSNLVSSLSAEVQQMLLELSILEDDLEAEDERAIQVSTSEGKMR